MSRPDPMFTIFTIKNHEEISERGAEWLKDVFGNEVGLIVGQ
jgi:hypothetical protein